MVAVECVVKSGVCVCGTCDIISFCIIGDSTVPCIGGDAIEIKENEGKLIRKSVFRNDFLVEIEQFSKLMKNIFFITSQKSKAIF